MMNRSFPKRGPIGILSRAACVLLLAVLPAACDALNPIEILPTWTPPVPYTPGPTPTPQPTLDPRTVLFEDRFDDPASGWTVGDYESGSYQYRDGVYSIQAREKSIMEWVVVDKVFPSDVVVEVDVLPALLPLNDNAGFGVLCRVQSNGDGYMLRISGDGYYTIFKLKGDEFIPLVDWTETGFVHPGMRLNHLVASCRGNSLALSVNGFQLASVEDDAYTGGGVGLSATSFELEPIDIQFDNFVVHE